MALNSHQYLIGNNSIQGTFTSAGEELGDSKALDVTDYKDNGVIILPTYISDVTKLASIEVRLKVDDSNYYSVSSANDSIGDNLIDGWNMIAFQMAGKSTQGTVDPSAITEWSIIATATSGETINLIFDKLTIQQFAPYYLQYFSKNAFVDGSTGAMWQETGTFTNQDKVNIDRDTAKILKYEICLLVIQSSTFENVNSGVRNGFVEQLTRAYRAYRAEHPATREPYSYSKSPEIDISQDIDAGS